MKRRLTGLSLICFLASFLILGKAGWIQIYGDERLAKLAKRQFQSRVLIRPRRGMILDREGEPLAVNVERHSLAASPRRVDQKDRRTLARALSRATGVKFSKILKKLRLDRQFVWIKRHLSEKEEKGFMAAGLLQRDGTLKDGLWLVRESQRVYPHGEVAAHVIGDVNVDSDGIEGAELWKDETLRGKVISVKAIRDALGRPSFIDADAARHIKSGDPITLTIDASLQYAVEQELKKSMKSTRARAGTVIAMDAESGEILAMANAPTFNPNRPVKRAKARRNRAITDGYEPGSTMKPLLMAAALNHGWKRKREVWGGLGKVRVQGKTITEAESHEKFKWLSLGKMVEVSSNVGAAKVAMGLKGPRLGQAFSDLGFGKKTGVGFPGEFSGKLPALNSKTQPLTLATLGFGQGLMTTRLQMVRAYGAILNGGFLVEPTLLRGTEAERGQRKRIWPGWISRQVIQAMERVVYGDEGTGKVAHLEGYRVAGKTGTAQVVDSKTRRYSKKRYISSFIGFALHVEPKIVVFASLDYPKGKYYAAATAAPLFREVLKAVTRRFGIPAKQEEPDPLAVRTRLLRDRIARRLAKPVQLSRAHMDAVLQKRAVTWKGKSKAGEMTWKMPDLVGLSGREAMKVLRGYDFKLKVTGFGLVVSQHPSAGERLLEGDLIKIKLRSPSQVALTTSR